MISQIIHSDAQVPMWWKPVSSAKGRRIWTWKAFEVIRRETQSTFCKWGCKGKHYIIQATLHQCTQILPWSRKTFCQGFIHQAMDFFLGLEKWKIHQFKANYLNSLQVTLIDLPEDLNKMFALANNWKAKGTDRRGLSQYLYMQLKWRKIRKEIRIIIMRITCKRLRRMMPKSHV